MNVLVQQIIPPAPKPPVKDLPTWRLLREIGRNSLAIWPDYTFDALVSRNSVLGIDSLLISDPAGVRHVLTTNAANYRRPVSLLRVIRPLAGNGVLLEEGSQWRRQRRMLAPLFTPKTIGLLIPHFHIAAEGLVRQVRKHPYSQSLVCIPGCNLGRRVASAFFSPCRQSPRWIGRAAARLHYRARSSQRT